jgi:hypothetical protein
MLYQCLRKSITSELHAKVSVNQTHYYLTIPGPTPQDPVTKCQDGVCFLKAIIDETYTNTLNNAAVARSNLATLGQYMKKLDDSNILSFNKYVKENVQELAAAGETTTDLLVNLLNGYREAKDKPFRVFVTRTEDDWLFRRITLANDGLALMELTSNYYQDHVKRGLWLKPDETTETILALKALQQQHGLYRRNPGNKTTRSDSRSKKQDKDWKTKPPRKGESTTKSVTIQGKVYVYHWCPHHRKWTIHPPKDCLLKKKEAEKGKKEKATANTDGTPTLKAMTAAFQEAILGESGLDTPFPS